ncbi:MAG: thioesterase family protein [Christensenellales bacterium]
MEYPFHAGDHKQLEFTVDSAMTAAAFASGTLDVLSTPYMIAKMEEAAACLISLNDGITSSVGTMLQIKHVSATPVGMKFRTEATIVQIDGRAVRFDIKAYDEAGLIGEGVHERYIINIDRFMEKTYNKLKK